VEAEELAKRQARGRRERGKDNLQEGRELVRREGYPGNDETCRGLKRAHERYVILTSLLAVVRRFIDDPETSLATTQQDCE
jgi:hypothetical protein